MLLIVGIYVQVEICRGQSFIDILRADIALIAPPVTDYALASQYLIRHGEIYTIYTFDASLYIHSRPPEGFMATGRLKAPVAGQ